MGEKPTKYFLNLERSNYNKKTILRIKTNEGEVVSDEKLVSKQMTEFYQKLYSKPKESPLNVTEYIKQCSIPQISHEEQEKIDQDVLEVELGQAVEQLKNQKNSRSRWFTS